MRVVVDTIRVRGERPASFDSNTPSTDRSSRKTGPGACIRRAIRGQRAGTAGISPSCRSTERGLADLPGGSARWKLPTENLVYADVDGHIGWIAAGLMPVRAGRVSYPYRATPLRVAGRCRARAAAAYDPPSGMIVTANHTSCRRGIPRLNYDWAPPYAHSASSRCCAAHPPHGERFGAAPARRILRPGIAARPILLAAARRRGAAARSDIAMLDRWDFTMRRDQAAPLLYEAWLKALGPDSRGLRPACGRRRLSSSDLGTSGDHLQPIAARDSLVLTALDEAIADLSRRLGADRSHWSWAPCTARPSAIPWPRRSTWETCTGR